MDEFAMTTLGLVPSAMAWDDFNRKVEGFFEARREPYRISDVVSVLEVEKDEILRSLPRKSGEALMAQHPEKQFWRRVTVDIVLVNTSVAAEFLFFEGAKQSRIEVRFPSNTYMAITGRDYPPKPFDFEAKAALVTLMLQITKAFASPAFGYKRVRETELVPPIGVDALRNYVETSDRWQGDTLHLTMAGIEASLVRAEDFQFDASDTPMTYAKDGFYLYDNLWPDPES